MMSWFKNKLIPQARYWYKFISTQLTLIGTTLIGFAPDIHQWLLYALSQYTNLPVVIQQEFNSALIQGFGISLVLLSIPARLVTQKSVDDKIEN